MSDENRPGDVPPDLPPEYAEAYRRGYESARNEGDSFDPAERTQVTGPLFADEAAATPPQEAEPTQTLDRGSLLGQMLSVESDRPVAVDREPKAANEAWQEQRRVDDDEPRENPTWLVPLILGIAAFVLILLAFLVGRWVAEALSGTDSSSSADSGSAGSRSSSGGGALAGKKYTGPVKAVAIQGASASCQAPNGVDASGNSVSYAPSNVFDRDATTAWRCDGSGVGQKLTLRIPAGTKIAEVGLIPGYAKTDPTSGEDRYAENDRITKVRWIFDGGKSVVQTVGGSPHNRSVRTLRIPQTTSGKVVIEILRTVAGPRHTTAISGVLLGAPG